MQQYSCSITGELNPDIFKEAWVHASRKYSALRSLVAWRNRDKPLQVVREEAEQIWVDADFSGLSRELALTSLDDFATAQRLAGFDLEKAPLFRLSLARLSDRTWRFLWTFHHIILDGWSMNLVLEDVLSAYRALELGGSLDLGTEVSWQDWSEQLQRRPREEAKQYWDSVLDGFTAPNLLNTSASESASPYTSRQEQTDAIVPPETTRRLLDQVKRRGVTLDSALKACWATLVSRYSGDLDVVFGATVSGRDAETSGSLEVVGLAINTIPVRVQVGLSSTFAELLTQIHSDRIRAMDHEWAPLNEIQAWSEIPSGQALFESLLVLQNLPATQVVADDLDITDVEYPQRSNFPLVLLVHPGDAIDLQLLFDPERFDDVHAAKLLEHFVEVVTALAQNADSLATESMTVELADYVDAIWREHEAPQIEPVNVIDEIVMQASQRPDALAVIADGHALTYSALMSRAARVASEIDALLPSSSQRRVALMLDRSPATIVAIIATHLAGAAYVPIDTNLPESQIDYMLEQSSAGVVVISADDTRGFDLPSLLIDRDGHSPSKSATAIAPKPVELDDLAYVIFTSGSTGTPKAVPISHRNLAYSNRARSLVYDQPVNKFLLLSPYFFDSSVAGIFWTLTSGGALVLPPPGAERDILAIGDLIVENRISHTLMLPSVLKLLLGTTSQLEMASLEVVIAAGEQLPASLAATYRDLAPEWRLFNEYGPTEATVWATVHEVSRVGTVEGERVPVGYPIPSVTTYILDQHSRPVPTGAVGELVIAGPTVSRGYIGADEGRRFSKDPVGLAGNGSAYWTGDLARYLPDGNIDLVGRNDRQIKVRGRRIEPAEIEQQLATHSLVSAAAIVATQSGASTRLRAIVETKSPLSVESLRAWMERQLPDHLMPHEVDVVRNLARLANGKVDLEALQRRPESPGRAKSQPHTKHGYSETEMMLLDVASELTGDGAIALEDNFFDAGGDSLMSMQLIARIFKKTGVRIEPNAVLFKTLGQVAALISGEETQAREREAESVSTHAELIPGGAGRLFTITHLPSAPTRTPVLLVPPYGWEYYKSHSALKNLAGLLSRAGHPVMRFDYYGTGDSEGTPQESSAEQWVEDIDTAANHLIKIAGGSPDVVGLRLGGAIAALWSLHTEDVAHLVLWDPVVNGRSHISSMRSMDAKFWSEKGRRNRRWDRSGELLGSTYNPGLYRFIMSLDLSSTDLGVSERTTIVASSDERTYRSAVAGYEDRVKLEVVPDAGGWDDLRTFNSLLLPGPILRHIATVLGGTR